LFPQLGIDDFRKYWRRRKPGSSTAVHYTSDVHIFFKWIEGRSPEAITVHDVDRFIVWQQSLGHAPATVTGRLIALRMFYDYLAYARDHARGESGRAASPLRLPQSATPAQSHRGGDSAFLRGPGRPPVRSLQLHDDTARQFARQ
jgi:site-specific recombinase XerD